MVTDGQTHLEQSTVTIAAHACRGLISNQNSLPLRVLTHPLPSQCTHGKCEFFVL